MNNIILIIPAYNEEKNIVDLVEKIIKNCPQLDYVVVNDGSTDSTLSLCKSHGFRTVDIPINLGLGGAFQTGLKYAERNGYEYAVQCDGDGQHNPLDIFEMCKFAESENADIVIGSRFIEGKKGRRTLRMLGSRIITFIIRIVTGKTIFDPTSGMRVYNSKMIHIMANNINFEPEPDTIAFLMRCGAVVKEYPTVMMDRLQGESYLNHLEGMKYMVRICSSLLVAMWFRKKVDL